MNTRMATMAIGNARRHLKYADKRKPAPAPTKGLLLRRTNDTMSNQGEPEAVALLRRVQKSLKNVEA